MTLKWLAAASLAIALVPGHVHAQDVSAEVAEASPHAQLLDVMQSGIDEDRVLDNALAVVRSHWEADPNIVAAEARRPGLMDAMLGAAMPLLKRQNVDNKVTFRPKFVAALRSVLNDSEAREITAFYQTPIGKKMLQGVSQNSDFSETIGSVVKDRSLSTEDVARDIDNAAIKTAQQMTEADKAAMVEQLTSKPALQKLPAIQQAIMPVRMEMERSSMSPEFLAEMQGAIGAAAQRHMAGG